MVGPPAAGVQVTRLLHWLTYKRIPPLIASPLSPRIRRLIPPRRTALCLPTLGRLPSLARRGLLGSGAPFTGCGVAL